MKIQFHYCQMSLQAWDAGAKSIHGFRVIGKGRAWIPQPSVTKVGHRSHSETDSFVSQASIVLSLACPAEKRKDKTGGLPYMLTQNNP